MKMSEEMRAKARVALQEVRIRGQRQLFSDKYADLLACVALEAILPDIEMAIRENLLWCCHVRGPDDVHAAPDYDTALKWADMLNDLSREANKKLNKTGRPEDDVWCKAAPALWPWSSESHAESLPESIAGFSLPPSTQEKGDPT